MYSIHTADGILEVTSATEGNCGKSVTGCYRNSSSDDLDSMSCGEFQ